MANIARRDGAGQGNWHGRGPKRILATGVAGADGHRRRRLAGGALFLAGGGEPARRRRGGAAPLRGRPPGVGRRVAGVATDRRLRRRPAPAPRPGPQGARRRRGATHQRADASSPTSPTRSTRPSLSLASESDELEFQDRPAQGHQRQSEIGAGGARQSRGAEGRRRRRSPEGAGRARRRPRAGGRGRRFGGGRQNRRDRCARQGRGARQGRRRRAGPARRARRRDQGQERAVAQPESARAHALAVSHALTVMDPLACPDPLAERRYAWAQAAAAEGDWAERPKCSSRALARAPDWAPGWASLGEAREKLGDLPGAAAAYARRARRRPQRPPGRRRAARAAGKSPRSTALPPAYVARLFDDYAPRFDRHLTETLGYRGPELILAALDAVAPGRRFAAGARSRLRLGAGGPGFARKGRTARRRRHFPGHDRQGEGDGALRRTGGRRSRGVPRRPERRGSRGRRRRFRLSRRSRRR